MSATSAALKVLIAEGMVEESSPGHYRLTAAGRARADDLAKAEQRCPECPHCIAQGKFGVLDPDDPALTTNLPRGEAPARRPHAGRKMSTSTQKIAFLAERPQLRDKPQKAYKLMAAAGLVVPHGTAGSVGWGQLWRGVDRLKAGPKLPKHPRAAGHKHRGRCGPKCFPAAQEPR